MRKLAVEVKMIVSARTGGLTKGLRSCPRLRCSPQRKYSVKPDEVTPEASQRARTRIRRVNARLPRFLQRYTTSLMDAPLTHISAFLLLHEVTAIVPLVGLAATFHYTQWLPPFISEGKWVSDGIEKFGRYFRRKGWLEVEGVARRDKWWSLGESGARIIVE